MAKGRFNSNGKLKEELPKVKVSKKSLREALEIFRYVLPYKGKFIAGLIFISLSSATTLSYPYLLKKLIDSANDLINGIQAVQPGTIALWMLGILMMQTVFSYLRVYLFTYTGEHALGDLRKDVYRHLIQLPMEFFVQKRVGELSSRISSDLSQIQDAVTLMLAEILRGVLTLVIGIGLIFYISRDLAFLMLSIIPVIVVVGIIFGKRIRKLSRESQDQLADSNIIVQETFQGISNVKAFSNEWFEIGRYSTSLMKVVRLAVRNGKVRGIFVSFIVFSLFGSIILVVWYGVHLMQQHQLSFGALTAFVIYTTFVGGSMAGFADLYGQLQKTLGATQRVRELLKETKESVSIVEEEVKDEYRLHGKVELRNVAFAYPSRREIGVLKDVSIKINPGEQVALVGPSGAGKSTVASLLLRFYDPDQGQLLMDGRDAKDIPLSQLRRQMAVVPQDVLLFGGTIRENIAYGKPSATMEEIESAAKQAYAHEFIDGFPEGYETVVGERGIKLSGGQRQRVAIARAILKNPVILILDEATSSLDSASESLVQDALENLMKNRTSIIIAHRLSTIRKADKIVVLDKGIVKETGTHEELLSLDEGLYRNLSRLQLEWD